MNETEKIYLASMACHTDSYGKQQEAWGKPISFQSSQLEPWEEEGISPFSTERAEIATVCEVRNTDVGGKGHRGKDRN